MIKNKFNIPIITKFVSNRKNIIYKRELPDIWITKIRKRYINNRIYSIMIVISIRYK
jgi:hypothetical protein